MKLYNVSGMYSAYYQGCMAKHSSNSAPATAGVCCCYKGLDGDAFTATSETLSEIKSQRPQTMPGKKTCTLDCWRHPKPFTGSHSIQARMTPGSQQRTGRQCKSLARLMFTGKVKAALRMISNEEKGGLLTPDQPVGDGGENALDIL